MWSYSPVEYLKELPADIPPVSVWEDLKMAWPVGQVADKVYPLPDGARLHYQLFPDGTESIHIDRFDPDKGWSVAVAHLSAETPIGLVVTMLFAGFGVYTLSRIVK